MKTGHIFMILLGFMLCVGLVSAETQMGSETSGQAVQAVQVAEAGTYDGQPTLYDAEEPTPELIQEKRKLGELTKIQAGQTFEASGKQVQVQAGEGEKLKLQVGGVEAQTKLQLSSEETQEGGMLKAKLSNGREAEIKVMPDVASETALERLRLRTCSEENNCTIELKEVGKGEETRLAYEVQIERHSRILGIFRAKMQVRSDVDAETGEVIEVDKPWWAFIATEPAE